MMSNGSCSAVSFFGALPTHMHIGDRVRKAREALGITQNELGRRAGLKTGYVSRIESGDRGKRTSGDVATALAQALGVRYEWLLHGKGPQRLQQVEEAEIVSDKKTADRQSDSLRAIVHHPSSRNRWSVSAVAIAYEHASMLQDDPGPAYWVHYLDGMSKRTRALLQEDVPKLFEDNPSESGLVERAGPNSSTPPKRRIS